MQPTDEQLARQVRRDVQQLASRTRLTGDALDKQAIAAVKTRHRDAVALLGEEAIMALTRRLGLKECSWCKVRELCEDKSKPLPQPAPALRIALGSMCSPCKVAWNAVESAAYENTLVASLTAAGIRPELSGVLRSAEEVARYKRGVGADRPATRKAPAPSCYRPGRPR
jgi:hypothetical protein